MKIIFCSTMFTEIEENLKKSKAPNAVSGHKYQENIIRGLIANGCDLTVVNIPRIRRYPDYKKIFIKKQDFKMDERRIGITVGCINLFVINYISASYKVYRTLNFLLKKNKDEKIILMAFNTYLPQTYAMKKIKSKYSNIILCDVIGDIHNPKFGISNPIKGIKGKFVQYYERKQDENAKYFDCFVLHTSYMASALNIEDKPYVEVECPFNPNKDSRLDMNYEKRNPYMIFYAGNLSQEYGVKHLIRAFEMIEEDNYRLILAGSGPLVDYINEIGKRDRRIQYVGYISPDNVTEFQKKASVTISPRTTEYEYVKYSFPSKTMECLASGVPFIAHRIPSVPEEYDKYIFYPNDESDVALKDKIVEVCNLSQESLNEHVKKTREFILKKKTPKALTEKVVELLLKIEVK